MSRRRGNEVSQGDIFRSISTESSGAETCADLLLMRALNDRHGDHFTVRVDDRTELVEVTIF